MEQRRKQEAIKQREREMKAEKEGEVERKKTITRERKQMAEEKARLEIMAQKVSHHNRSQLQSRELSLTTCGYIPTFFRSLFAHR